MTKLQTLALTDDKLDSTVKIQGTKYDRKRTISDKSIKKMRSLYRRKKSISEIASKLGVSYLGVRYNVDPVFKAEFNAKRDGKHTGKTHITVKDRVAYKRSLVAAGKISV